MNKYLIPIIIGLSVLAAGAANATLLTATVTGNGTYNNIGKLTDGVIPAENISGSWKKDTTWWENSAVYFILDFGSVVTIDDLLLSVRYADAYKVEYYSSKDADYKELFTIKKNYGESTAGMDTFSTDSTHAEYLAALDFTSIQSRYLRVSASGSSNKYSIGEIQAFGIVPEPTTMLLFGTGLVGLAGIKRRRR